MYVDPNICTDSQVTVTNLSGATPDMRDQSFADGSSNITKEVQTLKKPNKPGSDAERSFYQAQRAYGHVRSKTERDNLKQHQHREFYTKMDQVMGSNLQSGSYVLEQDGTGHESLVGSNAAKTLPLKVNPKRHIRNNTLEQRTSQREKGKKTAEASSRNPGNGSKSTATEDLSSPTTRAKMAAERSSTV